MVFQRLLDSGLRLKKSKCVFLVQEVSYLGYIISKDGVKADPAKIEAIKNIPRPQNVTELRSFLGLVNFFAKFVNKFSQRLVPLYNLLRKGVEWSWSDKCEDAYTNIKETLTGAEVLAHYDPEQPLVVTCDASAVGVGGAVAAGPRRRARAPSGFRVAHAHAGGKELFPNTQRGLGYYFLYEKISPIYLRSPFYAQDGS